MKNGLQWYKREPVAYLGGVQGLTAKQHAVYAVALDLIYAHGGSINNDPRWLSGWISDMGQAAVRTAIQQLCDMGKLTLEGDQISQKRAKREAKTREIQRETARKNGRMGGRSSADSRARSTENKDLTQADWVSREEKSREERSANALPKKVCDANGHSEKPKRSHRSPKRPLPEEWAPDLDKARALMAELDLNRNEMNYCYQQMREHAYANDRRQVDWDRAFNAWVRKSINLGEVGPGSRSRKGKGSVLYDI